MKRLNRAKLNEYARTSIYLLQTGRGYLTPKQKRRINHKIMRDQKRMYLDAHS